MLQNLSASDKLYACKLLVNKPKLTSDAARQLRPRPMVNTISKFGYTTETQVHIFLNVYFVYHWGYTGMKTKFFK